MTNDNMLQAALGYAARGWHVFPLRPMGKEPKYDGGFKIATADADTIRAWWTKTPAANIGLACGASGLVVLDFDTTDEDFAGWDLLERLAGEFATRATETASGGYHYLYRQPEGEPLGNSARGLPAGVDVRGDGGYVVLAPSQVTYTAEEAKRKGLDAGFTGSYFWLADTEPQPLPDFLVDLLRPPVRLRPIPPASTISTNGNGYASAALRGELDTLARAREGERNERLNVAAFNLGQLVGGGALDEAATAQALADTAQSIGLGEREAVRTIGSGLEAGMAQPRGAPEEPRIVYPTNADGAALESEPLTDLGNAQRFARLHAHDLRWVYVWDWLVWNGKAWEFDRTGEVMRRAKTTALTFFGEHDKVTAQARQAANEAKAATEREDAETANAKSKEADELHAKAKALLSWVRQCQNRARLEAMVKLAESELPIPALASSFDNAPWLLNVQNGTLDLRTGELRGHDRADLLTVTAPVEYDPEADCPTWLAFLDRIMAGNQELVGFLRRLIGYSLTGDVSEQKLFFAWGTGANGKSTFFNTILAMMGTDYAAQAAPDLLLVNRGRHPTELADLRGKRLVASIEVDEGKNLAEGLVKMLTGSDKLKARFMRQDFFQFDPTHKLILVANHKPVIRGTDHAIWRRICLIPFDVTIPEVEQDKALPFKLQMELPGILAWAVRGCLEWQRDGLQVPAAVAAATEQYRSESDMLGAFLEECTTEGETLEAKAGDLYNAYKIWCEQNGEHAVTAKTLAKKLEERGYDKYRKTAGFHYIGLGLLEMPQHEPLS